MKHNDVNILIIKKEDFGDMEYYQAEVERIRDTFSGWMITYNDRTCFFRQHEKYLDYLSKHHVGLKNYTKI